MDGEASFLPELHRSVRRDTRVALVPASPQHRQFLAMIATFGGVYIFIQSLIPGPRISVFKEKYIIFESLYLHKNA